MSSETDPRSADFAAVQAYAREALAAEFQRSVRIENKAQLQVTLGGAWFATVQAVAGGALRIDDLDRTWAWSIGGLALLSLLPLVAAVAYHARVARLAKTGAITPTGLLAMADAANSGRDSFQNDVVIQYANALADWRRVNHDKTQSFKRGEKFWYVALALILVQLAVAVFAHAA